jgi:hypothetical protein
MSEHVLASPFSEQGGFSISISLCYSNVRAKFIFSMQTLNASRHGGRRRALNFGDASSRT